MTVTSLPSHDRLAVRSVYAIASDKLRPQPLPPKRLAWLETARPNQLPPAGDDWDYWFVLAGRGFGKTRMGSEHVVQFARDNPGAEIGVVGRTDAEARRILMRGPSGILKAVDDGDLDLTFGAGKGYVESPGDSKIRFANGSMIYVVGANSPDALRGLNLWLAWCDELAAWRYQDIMWDEVLEPAVRIGPHPHILVTTTPKPTKLIRRLLVEEGVRLVRGSTLDNVANLAAKFIKKIRRKYDIDPVTGLARTRAGRQEINAEVLSDVVGALLTADIIEQGRYRPVLGDPDVDASGNPIPGTAPLEFPGIKLDGLYREAVVALDPSDGEDEGDGQGVALVGLGYDHHLYLEETWELRESPTDFLRFAIELALDHEATIVVEKNHGGKYLVVLLQQVMKMMGVVVPYRVVTASQGKMTRAERIAPLFVNGDARMVGHQVEVEDELTSWTGISGEKSPNRFDATVWGLTHFMGHALKAPAGYEETDGVYAASSARDVWDDDDHQDYSYG